MSGRPTNALTQRDADRLAAHIAKTVAVAPPLTEAQKSRLSAILNRSPRNGPRT